jgi:hypothetical protein
MAASRSMATSQTNLTLPRGRLLNGVVHTDAVHTASEHVKAIFSYCLNLMCRGIQFNLIE